jgi:hypothetical protein
MAATLVALVIGPALARRERRARFLDGASVFAFVMRRPCSASA